MPKITFRNASYLIEVAHKNVSLVEDFSLEVKDGELLVLTGDDSRSSSAVLEMAGGLKFAAEGKIEIDGEPPQEKRHDIVMVREGGIHNFCNKKVRNPWELRGVRRVSGYMTSLLKGSSQYRLPSNGIEERIVNRAKFFFGDNTQSFLQKRLWGCTPQERVRMNLACAFGLKAPIYLFDNPFESAVPYAKESRQGILKAIRQAHFETSATILYATPNLDEAVELAMPRDGFPTVRMAVMIGGKLQQVDNFNVLYNEPTNLSVASFLGYIMLNGQVRNKAGRYYLDGDFGKLDVHNIDGVHKYKDKQITLGIGVDDVKLIERGSFRKPIPPQGFTHVEFEGNAWKKIYSIQGELRRCEIIKGTCPYSTYKPYDVYVNLRGANFFGGTGERLTAHLTHFA